MTEIEHWLRDPYTIYAKHILRLTPLDPIDAAPGRRRARHVHPRRHRRIHATLCRRAAGRSGARAASRWDGRISPRWTIFPRRAPSGGRASSASRAGSRDWEIARRAGISAIAAEIRGEIDIPLGDGAFKLRGIADRIERDADGRYIILDYKTGAARTEKQVRTGLAPQLTLEAAMLRQGEFKDIPAGASVAEIGYVLLKGGEPPGEPKMLKFKEGTPDSHADRALEKLTDWPSASTTPISPIARSCIRCGRPITATTTISPASRNGRAPAARPTIPEAANETARRHSRLTCANCSAPCPTRPSRPGSPPMPAPARPTCWSQRVINLLLDGVEPEKILCITFTKAAAANMAKRVFDTLAEWTTLDDAGTRQSHPRAIEP